MLVLLGFAAGSVSGCVSSSTYEAVKKEAEALRHELQQERLKLGAIEKTYAERMKQMEHMISRLGSSAEQFDRIAKSWGELRMELMALRINRELERQKSGGGVGIVLQNDMPSTMPGQ
jgi:hypothetical protein